MSWRGWFSYLTWNFLAHQHLHCDPVMIQMYLCGCSLEEICLYKSPDTEEHITGSYQVVMTLTYSVFKFKKKKKLFLLI